METQSIDRRDTGKAVLVWTMVIHALCPVVWIFLAVYTIPRFSSTIAGMMISLPLLTRYLIYFSQATVQYWYLAFLVLFILLAADGTIFYLLGRNVGKNAGRLWSAIVLLGQLTLTVIGFAAMIIVVAQISSGTIQ